MPARRPFLSRFVYSKKVNRYFRRSNGNLVPPSEIATEVDRLIQYAMTNLESIGLELDGELISLRDWQNQVKAEIQNLHLSIAAAARGGMRNLDETARRQIQGVIKEQLTYLRNFALEIQTGRQELNGAFYNRLKAYARITRQTFYNSELQAMRARGIERARRLLGVAEHCTQSARPGCVEEAAKGYVDINLVIALGKCTCLYNCKCKLEYEGGFTREEVAREQSRIRKRLQIAA